METENTATEELFDEALQPSVPTGSDEDACCQVCHEPFVQFYNDEKEEWHLRPAVSFEDKNFHPFCLEDHKRALEELATSAELNETNEENKDKTDDSIKCENNICKEEDVDNESKVIDTIKEEVTESVEEDMSEENEAAANVLNEILDTIENDIEDTTPPNELTEDLIAKVPNEEVNVNTLEESTQKEPEISQDADSNMIVEPEVKDDLLKALEEPMDTEEFEESTTESVEVDSTQVEVKSTIDGNVDLDTSASIIPTEKSKIKINITKPINSPKEPKETKEEKEPVQEKPEEENIQPLKPASIKPALCDRNLSVLPPVFKGEELSALCSIM